MSHQNLTSGRSRSPYAFGLLALTTLAYVVAQGCAPSLQVDDTNDTTSVSSSGAGASGGSGGAAGTGGAGGVALPCGIDCSQIQAPQCKVAQCNEQTTQCEIVDVADGDTCDDGVFCTDGDTCVTGVCAGGPPNTCGMTPAACQSVSCNEGNQNCSFASLTNGTACQPTNLCISGATCTNGQCTGGTPTDCFFFPVPNPCNVAECDPMNGLCHAVPGNFGGPCLDQTDLCTVNKTCDMMGTCQGGMPKDCSFLDMNCTLGVCNTSSGICQAQPVMNGQPCNDLNACTTGETCNNMVCGNGTPVTVCSMTSDNCCPSNCNASTDIDCQTSCRLIKLATPSSTDGIYIIDVDAGGPTPPFNVYCDMTTDGGGWTLLSWTGQSSMSPLGVPYPGLAPCPGLTCLRGSLGAAPRPELLMEAATTLAQSQSTTFKTSFGPMSSYQYTGKHVFSSLAAINLNYGPNTCAGLITGTFTMLIGPTTYNGSATYLAQALGYASYNYSLDTNTYIWNIGVPAAYCNGSGAMPGSWMGTWSGSQYGPNIANIAGAYAVWVR